MPSAKQLSSVTYPLAVVCVMAMVLPSILRAGDHPTPVAQDVGTYPAQIRPFFENHCFECHGPDVAKAGLRLDTLTPDFSAANSAHLWTKILDRLAAGEMPPKKSARPPAQQQQNVIGYINGQLLTADEKAFAASPFHLRRMTRLQYENTVHDLLGIDTELTGRLPEDSRSYGFDNVGDALTLSPAQIEAYLEAADAALDAAIVHKPRPVTIKKRYIGRDVLGYGSGVMEGHVLDLDDAAVVFGRCTFNFPATIDGAFNASEKGRYRIRASVYAYQTKGEPVEIYVKSGRGADNHPVGYFAALPDTPRVLDFTCKLERYDTVTFGMHRLPYVPRTRNPEKFAGPGLAVQWIEVEGPLVESWPPPSHHILFGDLPMHPRKKPGPTPNVEVYSDQPQVEAQRLLSSFMKRAYRRPVSSSDLQPVLSLFEREFSEHHEFEDAMRAAYKTILCSPDFLFFQDKRGEADQFALASRLSYFLWNTTPDEQLFELAQRGVLSQPQTLHDQIERLLSDPKAQNFMRNFVAQWLDLRLIDFTTPDKKLYPEYDLSREALLRQSIVEETQLFFTEVLKQDLSVSNFVDSDFTFLNERLAEHYGITGVKGTQMRRVPIPRGSHRGGVLTQASVLKVTANGTNTSPVLRGVWVLRNLLGKPPEPPPPNAGAIEADIRGAKTIREQLEKHRRVPSCASCHVKIDPIGFALENFDVLGGWQENYRILRGPNLKLAKDGPKVETTSGLTLPNGTPISNLDDLKKYLLSDQDQLARCLAEKLLIYSTGRSLRFSDRAAVQQIVSHVREKNRGLRSLIHEVVQSKAFVNQ